MAVAIKQQSLVFPSLYSLILFLLFSLPMIENYNFFETKLSLHYIIIVTTLLPSYQPTHTGVRAVHSAAAWCVCGAFWSIFSSVICYFFFLAVLDHTSAIVPAFSLFLCGLSLGDPFISILSVLIMDAPLVTYLLLLGLMCPD